MIDTRKINLLDTIPIRSPQVESRPDGESIILAFPRFKRAWMNRFLPKGRSKYLTVQLEEHGTQIWNLIDGQHTVSEIIGQLAEHFDHEEGYESRVTTYLTQLQKDGFIKLNVKI